MMARIMFVAMLIVCGALANGCINECQSTFDCPYGEYCSDSGYCVDMYSNHCQEARDCGFGQICKGNRCVDR